MHGSCYNEQLLLKLLCCSYSALRTALRPLWDVQQDHCLTVECSVSTKFGSVSCVRILWIAHRLSRAAGDDMDYTTHSPYHQQAVMGGNKSLISKHEGQFQQLMTCSRETQAVLLVCFLSLRMPLDLSHCLILVVYLTMPCCYTEAFTG